MVKVNGVVCRVNIVSAVKPLVIVGGPMTEYYPWQTQPRVLFSPLSAELMRPLIFVKTPAINPTTGIE